VLHLARSRIDTVLTCRSGKDEAEQVVADVEALGARTVALQLDTADTAGFPAFTVALKTALQQTWQRENFDFPVNNAGTGIHRPFAETTEADCNQLMNAHVKGVFFLTRHLLPLIADGGRILNVSSGLARISLPG
jgi:NAD(P)-dependent dehydrogenase (short-subunit alcohol dehydrogenase family)